MDFKVVGKLASAGPEARKAFPDHISFYEFVYALVNGMTFMLMIWQVIFI